MEFLGDISIDSNFDEYYFWPIVSIVNDIAGVSVELLDSF
jgi:hypothetical protein